MNKLAEYKKMVMALVIGGIEIKPALDAAELVVFGATEKEIQEDPNNPKNWPEISRLDKYDYITQREIAQTMGLTTKAFNIILKRAGYIDRVMLDKYKKISGSYGENYLSTYILTEKGKKIGMSYGHVKYTDGSVAVYRFKWKRSIITELRKLD
ncbi:hypothetical protein OAA60_01020 [Porticoccaceae bacterium]|nr:hypothetical protein [Porticoccaceae bacterium]